MNSIEIVSNPEKKAPQQAADGPVLRVFVKEGNAYTLQHETKDYQQAMKQAGKFHDKDGKDILVNEKDNPNIVHAKTNRNKDVNVGREIRPNQTQGIAVKGTGEIVLASFYEKLPMDTKTFDAQERAGKEKTDPDQPASPEGKVQFDKIKVGAEFHLAGGDKWQKTHEDAAKLIETTKSSQDRQLVGVTEHFAKNLDVTAAAPAQEEPSKAKASPDAKAYLNKTGYELPEKLLVAYTVKDGKFHDRDSNALRFEDHGNKLSTPVEDPKVIGHMIEVAAAKNWGQLELKGTETFKQIAWLEAQSRGIETKGYKPNEQDLEQLEKLRQERGANEKQMAGPSAPSPTPAREQNEIVAAMPRILSPDEKMRVDVATKVMEKALAKLPENIRVDALAKMAIAVEKGDLKLPTPKVTERAIDKPRPAPAPAMDRGR